MMMQNVLAHVSPRAGITRERSTLTKKQDKSNFETILDNSIGTKITKDTKVTSKTEAKNAEITSVDSSDLKSKPTKVNEKVFTQTSEDQSKKGDESTFITSIAEQVLAMLDQIRSTIMESLELTSEELDQMMEELQLDGIDLLDPQAIKQLVLNNSGATDYTAILLDEQLGDTFRSLLMAVDDIKKEVYTELSHNEIEQTIKKFAMDISDNEEIIVDNKIETVQVDTDGTKDRNTSVETAKDTSMFRVVNESLDNIDREHLITSSNNPNPADSKEQDESSDKTDGFEAFLDKLNAHYEKPMVEITKDNVRLYNIKEIAQQIIERVTVMNKPGQTTMEIQLYPEHLGKVNLTLSSNEGVVSARFVVQNEPAKEAVEGQMITLKENLDQQGIKVESIEVTVASYTFDQNSQSDDRNNMQQNKDGKGHKITFEEAVAMSEESAAEDTISHIEGISGYNINYKA